jgi:RNA polymerase sigma factor (TIGR02999 family)
MSLPSCSDAINNKGEAHSALACTGLVYMSIAAALVKLLQEDRELHGPQTLPQLTPSVYADLRRLARSVMRNERAGHTLQPTAVVNEAFSRLIRAEIDTTDAQHFFRLAAQAMRHVLIDYAKQRNRTKRETPTLGEMQALAHEGWLANESATPLDVLDIDRALNALAERAPRAAYFLELRYFAGLEDAEISVICNVSKATVERECRFARAFLNAFSKSSKLQEPVAGFDETKVEVATP